MKKIIIALAIIIIAFLLVVGYTNTNNAVKSTNDDAKYLHQIDSLKTLCDSLRSEVFIESTNSTRYQIMFDIVEEEDPQTYETFMKIVSGRVE